MAQSTTFHMFTDLLTSASGLGKACALEVIKNGGNVAILDMNEDGHDLVKEAGSSAKFFVCDVLNSESVTKAVQGTAEWAKSTNKPIGGVIPAAGVSTPATVCPNPKKVI